MHHCSAKVLARQGLKDIWASGFVLGLTNRDLVLEIVNNFGSWLVLADECLRKDPEVAMVAVKNDGLALQHVHWSLHDDHELVISALENDGLALEHVRSLQSTKIQSTAAEYHFDLVVAAITQNPYAYRFAGYLKEDPSVISIVDKTCYDKKMSDKQIDKFFTIMARPCISSSIASDIECKAGKYEDGTFWCHQGRKRRARKHHHGRTIDV